MGRPRKDRIEVRFYWNKPKSVYVLWWLDPLTSKKRTKVAKSTKQSEVSTEAARLELELTAGRGQGNAGWEKIRTTAQEHYPRRSPRGWTEMLHTIYKFDELIGSVPDMGRFVETDVREFKRQLRDYPLSVASVSKHLRNLRALLNWAKREKLITTVPHIEIDPAPKGYAGKADPASEEEIKQLCQGIKEIVGAKDAPTWHFAIWGIRYSGLRLGEMLRITWDKPPVQLISEGRDVAIDWQAGQKSGKYEVSPAVPAFAELVLSVPIFQRHGVVFGPTIDGRRVGQRCVEKKIAAAAKIKGLAVSLHNLRRSFADDWITKVSMADLSKLMRCGVNVILRFYAKQEGLTASKRIREETNNSPKMGRKQA
jgi:integrase